MKTLKQVVKNVKVPNHWNRKHKTSLYKEKVLRAIGTEADDNAHADCIFAAIGLDVDYERVGRSYTPVVSRSLGESNYSRNTYGDYSGYETEPNWKSISDFETEVWDKVKQWSDED